MAKVKSRMAYNERERRIMETWYNTTPNEEDFIQEEISDDELLKVGEFSTGDYLDDFLQSLFD